MHFNDCLRRTVTGQSTPPLLGGPRYRCCLSTDRRDGSGDRGGVTEPPLGVLAVTQLDGAGDRDSGAGVWSGGGVCDRWPCSGGAAVYIPSDSARRTSPVVR